MFNITFFTNSCCIVKSTVRSAEEVSGQVCAASSAVWGADKDLVQSNFPSWHCLSVHLLHTGMYPPQGHLKRMTPRGILI